METEKEIHLTKGNQRLKARIREIEELFAETDEDYRQQLEGLVSENKNLAAKNTALESSLYAVKEENEELGQIVRNFQESAKNVPQQPTETQLNVLSDSFMAEYTDLQEKVDELNKNKVTLQARIRELEDHIAYLLQQFESLESTNADLTEALSSATKEKNKLAQENKYMAESVTLMQIQIDTMSAPKLVDQKEHRGNSLFGELEEERQKLLKQKAEMEQEVAVLRKTLASHGDEDRRKTKDVECMRDSLKTISERNKHLQRELERKADVEAESVAIKQAASRMEREIEILTAENARLKKQFVNAESRADENADLLSKAAVSKTDFIRGIQQQADLTNVHSTPRPIMKRTPSLSRNEPQARNHQRLPSVTRSSSMTPMARTPLLRIPSSPPKDNPPATRKRGIMLDYTGSANRRLLDFKVQKLSESSQLRQIDHLKSHYNPDIGTYDQSYGETPTKAAKLETPKKENKILKGILRR